MPGKSWTRGFEAARVASLHSNAPQTCYRMGAALYAGSILLSTGFNIWNKTTPHSVTDEFNGNTHAEIVALIRRWHYDKPNNLILYVWRNTTNPKRTHSIDACSRPCDNCMNLIKLAGVRRIRFYDETGTETEIKLKEI